MEILFLIGCAICYANCYNINTFLIGGHARISFLRRLTKIKAGASVKGDNEVLNYILWSLLKRRSAIYFLLDISQQAALNK